MEKETMKWYDDIREELTVVALAVITIMAVFLDPESQLAAATGGGLVGYLKGRKRNGQNTNTQ